LLNCIQGEKILLVPIQKSDFKISYLLCCRAEIFHMPRHYLCGICTSVIRIRHF